MPDQWGGYDRTRSLQWTRVQFQAGNASLIPERPGVYAFVLEHQVALDLPGAFPMYFGKAGSSLRDRYRAYQGQAFRGRRGRPKLERLFRTWRSFLGFYFVTELAGRTPEQLESVLLDALMPPMNESDFSAEVRALIAAF